MGPACALDTGALGPVRRLRRGTISNTAAFNAPLVGNPTLIPEYFDGWYAQAAYELWSRGDYALAPFVR